jgi:hypothetical protein
MVNFENFYINIWNYVSIFTNSCQNLSDQYSQKYDTIE